MALLQNTHHLHAAFERGLDSEEIVAYHGTSLQVLKYLLANGQQIGPAEHAHAEDLAWCQRPRDVYVYPLQGRTFIKGTEPSLTEVQALEAAKDYASQLAWRHSFLEALGFGYANSEITDALEDLASYFDFTVHRQKEFLVDDSDPVIKRLFQFGKTRDEIYRAGTALLPKRGVILGYSARLFQEGDPLPGDEGTDVRVQNVTLDKIVGIEPLDQECYDFLDSLPKRATDAMELDYSGLGWLTGKITLVHTDIPISLPPNTRLRYVGNSHWSTTPDEGQGHQRHNATLDMLDLIIDYNLDPAKRLQRVFIPAHEEGHVCQATGNLLALYRTAKTHGIDFYHLTEQAAKKSDAHTRKLLRREPLNVWNFRDPTLDVSEERIADVAGVIALRKAGVDPQIVNRILAEVMRPSFVRRVPELLQELDESLSFQPQLR